MRSTTGHLWKSRPARLRSAYHAHRLFQVAQFGEASDGKEAVRLWQEHRRAVALLVTDLVMPKGLSGQGLAMQLQAEQPRLKVLFMSGYNGEIAGQELELRSGENFLQKPFASDNLLGTIRRRLDE